MKFAIKTAVCAPSWTSLATRASYAFSASLATRATSVTLASRDTWATRATRISVLLT